MNGIIFNICAYAAMTVGAYYSLEYSCKNGSKITHFLNYAMMFWNMFMVLYLIKDYEAIVNSPLNVKLNFFESVTNWVLALWLISFKFRKK